jgi:hypothetical protein
MPLGSGSRTVAPSLNFHQLLGRDLNGKLYHTSAFFPFNKMHPVVRASVHLLLNNPSYIAQLQQQLREDFEDKNLLLDVREPKPPKFTTLIRCEDDGKGVGKPLGRNIFDRYYTAHGILIDSFNDLSVYVCSENEDLRVSAKKLRDVEKDTTSLAESYFMHLGQPERVLARRIVSVARQVRDQKSKQGTIIDIDLLLLVLFVVEEFAKQNFSERELWIYSDSGFQSYLHRVVEFCNDNKIMIESKFVWDNSAFSTKVFRDLERLINMGLVDHAHKLVPHPDNWGFRIDRRLSGWGKAYVGSEMIGLYHPLRRFVTETLVKVKGMLQEIIDNERACTNYDEINEITKREPLNQKIRQIREKLKKDRNLSLTLG